jgi:hypothetical protein
MLFCLNKKKALLRAQRKIRMKKGMWEHFGTKRTVAGTKTSQQSSNIVEVWPRESVTPSQFLKEKALDVKTTREQKTAQASNLRVY